MLIEPPPKEFIEEMQKDEQRADAQTAFEIKVTPGMVEVGVRAFWSFDSRFEDAEDVVKRIWHDMNTARNGETTSGGARNAPTLSPAK